MNYYAFSKDLVSWATTVPRGNDILSRCYNMSELYLAGEAPVAFRYKIPQVIASGRNLCFQPLQ